jgi:hypothetical protein
MIQWSGKLLQTSERSAGLLTIDTEQRPDYCSVPFERIDPSFA